MIEKVCRRIARSTQLNNEQLEIIIFGMECVISTLFSFALTLLLSWALGVWKLMLVVLASFALIQVSAGGTHCKTMLNCAIFSSLTFSLLAKSIELFEFYYRLYLTEFLVFTTVAAFIIHYFWSPAPTPEKPMSLQYRIKLRRSSFISLVVIFSVLYSLVLFQVKNSFPIIIGSILGLLCHSTSITPLGSKLINGVDYSLSWVLKGGVTGEKN